MSERFTPEELERWKRLDAEATAGPWRWELNLKSRNVRLCGGRPRFDLTVMDFERYGFHGAAPRFLERMASSTMMLLHRCERWAKVVVGREHHSDWFQAIDHPDANFMAEARLALPCLIAALEESEAEKALMRKHTDRLEVEAIERYEADELVRLAKAVPS
ncbi:MAG: hypothetical protein ABIT01_21090 [Thermoanaerobaculia bacterium]